MEALTPSNLAALEALAEQLDTRIAFELLFSLVREAPRQVAPLLGAWMERQQKSTTFVDAGFTHVSLDELSELVSRAVGLLEQDAEHDAAAACISYATLQHPRALAPHLRKLFGLRPNARCYYEAWPWRSATAPEIEALKRELGERASSKDQIFAWKCLLETRREEVLSWCLEHVPAALGNSLPLRAAGPSTDLNLRLAVVGFVQEGDVLRRLCGDACFHLIFDDAYLDHYEKLAWRPKDLEPSWTLRDESAPVARLGGGGSGTCARCGGELHMLLELDPVPAGLNVTSVQRLGLQTCLSCLGYEASPLFLQHAADGAVQMLGDHEAKAPEFPAGPLLETRVRLCKTPERWRTQDWALSNARENLHRLGGEPCWIQSADYPNCPHCKRTMDFLLQLDTDLPTSDGGEWMWGSGGIGYVFWCDGCRVSAALWQCT